MFLYHIKSPYPICSLIYLISPLASLILSISIILILDILLTSHFYHPHLNYTTPSPKIVEQIVNILPPTSPLYLSQSQNPRSILPQIMQQPSAQITISSPPRPIKSKLVKLRLHLLLFISASPYLSLSPKSAPKLSKN